MYQLAFDFGNSRAKLAVFKGRALVQVESKLTFTPKFIKTILAKYPAQYSIVASVVGVESTIEEILKTETYFVLLSHRTLLPIKNFYETPATLGMDRLANVVGAHAFFPKKNVLVISAGTCITYDVITHNGNYFGGNITPGLDLRLKAMHTFTVRLPLVKKKMTKELFGKSTTAAMLTGTIKGAMLEMQGFISEYKKKYPSLKVLLTGGDAPFFETMTECKIFAVPHLVLYGLNEILLLNHAKKT